LRKAGQRAVAASRLRRFESVCLEPAWAFAWMADAPLLVHGLASSVGSVRAHAMGHAA